MTSTFHLAGIPTMPRRNAFTLVELLVCITIIAILLAILLPALSMVMAAQNQTNCAGTQRALMQALTIYQSDNSGFGPHKWPNSSIYTFADLPSTANAPASSPISGSSVWGVYSTAGVNEAMGLGVLAYGGQPYIAPVKLFDPSCAKTSINRGKSNGVFAAVVNDFNWSTRFAWTFGTVYDPLFYTAATPGWDGTLCGVPNVARFTSNEVVAGDYAYRTGDFGYTTSLGQVGVANPGKSRASLAFTKPESVVGGGSSKLIIADDYPNQHLDSDGAYMLAGDTYNATFGDGSTTTVRGITADMKAATGLSQWVNSFPFWGHGPTYFDTIAPVYEEDLESHSSRRGGSAVPVGPTRFLHAGTISRVAASNSWIRTGMFDKIEQMVQSRGRR